MSGTVELAAGKSALVVVEGNGQAYSAVADTSGKWKVFNVAPGGGYKAQAYVKGANYTPADVSVQRGVETTGVALRKAGDASATLSGSVQLVAGANGAGTSVVMVVESTFNAALIRGEVPPGLRAPDPGTRAERHRGRSPSPACRTGSTWCWRPSRTTATCAIRTRTSRALRLSTSPWPMAPPSASPSFKVTGAIEMVGPGAGETSEVVAGTAEVQLEAILQRQVLRAARV